VPVLQYILLVGSVLTSLIFYANSVMIPAPLPFSVSQKSGLPEPYKAPAITADPTPVIVVPTPEIIASTAERAVEVKMTIRAVRKRKPTQVVRQTLPQGHYAAYPSRESEKIW